MRAQESSVGKAAFIARLILFLLATVPFHTLAAYSETEIHQASVCTGYLGNGNWGTPSDFLCPPHWAVIAIGSTAIPSSYPAESVSITPTCCPLPSKDILTKQSRWVKLECPEGFIATGAQYTNRQAVFSPTEKYRIHCSKINTERYMLSSKVPGAYWGGGSALWKQRKRFIRGQLPEAIRYAIGRIDKYNWLHNGCIGQQPGSYFTGKHSKHCFRMQFRQLQFRGISGDPPAGTPVPMLATEVEQLDPFAEVLNERSRSHH